MTSVRDWMTGAIESGSWRTFDDLHIDVPSPDVSRGEWVWEAIRAAREAVAARAELAPSFAVILGFSLCASDQPIRPEWLSLKDFVADLDDSPPSLYIFDRNSDLWTTVLEDTVAFDAPAFLKACGDARYRETWNDEFSEYYRSVLLVQ